MRWCDVCDVCEGVTVCRCGVREVREDGSFHVVNATNTSGGVYTCRLSNQYATLDLTATVTVTGLPR